MEFRRDRGGVIPVCMKEREFLWREMKDHHELPFENERCEMKERGMIFVPQELWLWPLTHRTALIMSTMITKFHTKAMIGPAGNTTGRHGSKECMVM